MVLPGRCVSWMAGKREVGLSNFYFKWGVVPLYLYMIVYLYLFNVCFILYQIGDARLKPFKLHVARIQLALTGEEMIDESPFRDKKERCSDDVCWLTSPVGLLNDECKHFNYLVALLLVTLLNFSKMLSSQ